MHGLRVEHIIKEATDKMIEHVGRETIQVKQLPNNFKLSVKVFISGTKVKNSVLYIYSSVDAVPRRMWVKPRAIYTPEYQNTWESLL